MHLQEKLALAIFCARCNVVLTSYIKVDLDSVFNCGTPGRTSDHSYSQRVVQFSRVVDAVCLCCIVAIPKCAYFYLLVEIIQ